MLVPVLISRSLIQLFENFIDVFELIVSLRWFFVIIYIGLLLRLVRKTFVFADVLAKLSSPNSTSRPSSKLAGNRGAKLRPSRVSKKSS